MSRRRLIITLTCIFYALQLAVVIFWHSLAGPDVRVADAVVSITLALMMGAVDTGIARFLIQALEQAEEAYATDVAAQLEQSLDAYRKRAEHEDLKMLEIGRSIEAELARARVALASGDISEVGDHMRTSLGIASLTNRKRCDNIAVAAVLESKERQCAEAGVALESNVSLPAELPIQDIEIAALFFNLIDNALHECEALAADGCEEALVISVRSLAKAGLLLVEVKNPCRGGTDPSRKAAQRRSDTALRHGWGTSIVRSIVEGRDGLAEFSEKDGVFTAIAMVPLSCADRQD